MFALVEDIKNSTQLRWNRVHKFQSKINFCIEMGPYLIKTAEHMSELVDSFKLRHNVFNVEFRGLNPGGMDLDRFDYFFDHLIIIHKETQKIIGTYRMNSSQNSTESYVALEFDTSRLTSRFDSYLELGRACIHKDFRKGTVIAMLWRGIIEYMKQSSAQVMFGCSSVKVNSPRDAALLYNYMIQSDFYSHDYSCITTPAFRMNGFENWNNFYKNELTVDQQAEASRLLPSLLKSYFKQGAKIICEPAFDREYDCIDFLTVLRTQDLSNTLAQRLQVVR